MPCREDSGCGGGGSSRAPRSATSSGSSVSRSTPSAPTARGASGDPSLPPLPPPPASSHAWAASHRPSSACARQCVGSEHSSVDQARARTGHFWGRQAGRQVREEEGRKEGRKARKEGEKEALGVRAWLGRSAASRSATAPSSGRTCAGGGGEGVGGLAWAEPPDGLSECFPPFRQPGTPWKPGKGRPRRPRRAAAARRPHGLPSWSLRK